jgi:cytochrome c553
VDARDEEAMRAVKITSPIVLVVLLLASTVSMAEEPAARSFPGYVPRLSDLMIVIQIRHSKLFYAVKRGNWPLADFELEQLNSTLKEAGRFYPKTAPASDLTVTDRIADVTGESIKAKDEAKFDRSFAEMTAECNRCHEAADRAFIYIRRPAFPSTFSNQIYGPRPAERNSIAVTPVGRP